MAGRGGRPAAGSAVAGGLVGGWVADRVLGDPQRGHPVAGLGAVAATLERRLHRDHPAAGALHWLVVVAPPVASTWWLQRRLAAHPLGVAALTAATGWAATGGHQLTEVAAAIAAAVESGDLAAARERLPWLVGRDPASLDGDGIVRAVVESVAENTADAVVGPLWWGAVAGPAGIGAHRAVKTLDAMVGHRSPRYARFGVVAARADDLANLVPARLTAALVCVLAPLVDGSPRRAWRTWRRDAPRHPSPNAGPVEAATAGALGVQLGGPLDYGHGVERRGPFGDGPTPAAGDIRRAVRLTTAVGAAAGGLAAALALVRSPVGRVRRG